MSPPVRGSIDPPRGAAFSELYKIEQGRPVEEAREVGMGLPAYQQGALAPTAESIRPSARLGGLELTRVKR